MCNFIWSEKQTIESAARQLDLEFDLQDYVFGDKNPTDNIIIALPGQLEIVRWSLIPNWSKEIPAVLMTQARVETLHEKPSFRGLLSQHRCIVPVTGFYEWFAREKFGITRTDDQPMYLAGIWDEWHGQKSAAIITTEPTEFVRLYQDRMPLVFEEEEVETWLSGDEDTARRMLYAREPNLKAEAVSGQQSLF